MPFKYESSFLRQWKYYLKGKDRKRTKHSRVTAFIINPGIKCFWKYFHPTNLVHSSLQVHHFLLPDYHSCAAVIMSLDYKYSQMLIIFLIIFTMFRTTYIQLLFGDYAKHLPINITFLAHNITLRREYNISG